MTAPLTLRAFLLQLRTAPVVPKPPDESWGQMIDRTRATGQVAAVDEETYWWFLECLPPKYQGQGCFAFAEGAEPLTIFWRKSGEHFCRCLTWDETQTFCRLAGIPLPR